MSPQDYDLLTLAREASKAIGTIFKNGLADTTHRDLAVVLLEELSNYEYGETDILQSEIQLGLLEGLLQEEILERQQRLLKHVIGDNTPNGNS
jgi:hypothetical protein